MIQVPAIPHTKTGKKLEVPINRLFQGAVLEDAADLGAVDDPDLVRHAGSPSSETRRDLRRSVAKVQPCAGP